MLKIVEVHAATGAQSEYIVLQNQGLGTVSLRGWALCSDAYLEGDPVRIAEELYIFRDDIPVKPYTRVVLFTGCGQDGWEPTIDGRQAYCAYWGRTHRIWTDTKQIHVLHLLNTQKVVPGPQAIAVSA